MINLSLCCIQATTFLLWEGEGKITIKKPFPLPQLNLSYLEANINEMVFFDDINIYN